jgi:transposase
MIQLTPQMRILVAVQPVDFRQGIDGLCRVCRQALTTDPFSGAVFVFRSRRGTSIKILAYDGQGFWLCQKRLSEGRFLHWPTGGSGNDKARQLFAHQVQVLLVGGNPESTQAANQWRPVGPAVAAAA